MQSKLESDAARVKEAASEYLLASDRPGGVNRAGQLQAELATIAQLGQDTSVDPELKAIAAKADAVAEAIATPAPIPTLKERYVAASKALTPQSGIPPVTEHEAIAAYKQRWGLK